MSSNSATLWLVATPLGNPGDLSPRARQVLESATLVLAEDTRRAGLLCQRCGVQVQRFTSFHDHNEQSRQNEILDMLRAGQSIALISDAGMPLLADPGYTLVRAARAQGIGVSVIPGPSAPITALAGSGIAPQPFTFLGFLPRKSTEQKSLFARFGALPTTLIFFERKDRLAKTLACAAEVLGARDLCIARELTKTHEEYYSSRLEAHASIPEFLGEITVIIGPPESETQSPHDELLECIAEENQAGGRPRDIARRVHARVQGWSVKEIYQILSVPADGEQS